MRLKTSLLTAITYGVTILSPFFLYAQDNNISYKPEIHGVIRARGEYATNNETGARFQVRNARVNIGGHVFDNIEYYAMADLCDRGVFKFQDGWIKWTATSWLKLQAGRQRIPFSIDASRGPQSLIFANRSFIGNQVGNVRAVGLKLATTVPNTAFYLEAGLFNGAANGTNQNAWEKEFTYSGKTGYKVGNVRAEFGVESVIPGGVRANLLDATLQWDCGRFFIEGEYMNKHYANETHPTVHAYNFMAMYRHPLRDRRLSQITFQGRFDGMTDHSDCVTFLSSGKLSTTDPARQRLTIGTSLIARQTKSLYAELRINFEHFFYKEEVLTDKREKDKLVAELVVAF